jgi:hypothetical protein
LFISPPIDVAKRTDYLLRLLLKIEQGSIVVEVINDVRNSLLASTAILHPFNSLDFTPETLFTGRFGCL